jgi:hypothetical protein
MTDRFAALLEKADDNDKAELSLAHNARIKAMRAFQESPGKATRDDKDACQQNYDDTLDRLWGKYHPEQNSAADNGNAWFRDKKAAYTWYADNGGTLTYSGFTRQEMTTNGRRVLRSDIDRMLIAELRRRTPAPRPDEEYIDTARDEARLMAAKADREEMRRDEERRQLDSAWVPRENADEEICVWTGRLRDATAYHLGKALLAIIHACGGQPARLAEVQALVDDALATACNEIANTAEITAEIEDDDQ